VHMLRVRGGAPPLNHEEIHSIMHQPDDGYFSNAEGEHPADQAPYYLPNGMFIEWPQWDDRWWWIRCANSMDVQGHSYWCFLRHPLDPSVDSMPFRMVESLAHLRLVEEAIDENRSYFVSGEEEGEEEDDVEDEKRVQVLEHGQPSRMRARALWEWHPPVVTAQNPPEWERLEWQELLAAVAERCYPWDSEDRVGWIPEQLDGGTL
jgi:hypothetical protein